MCEGGHKAHVQAVVSPLTRSLLLRRRHRTKPTAGRPDVEWDSTRKGRRRPQLQQLRKGGVAAQRRRRIVASGLEPARPRRVAAHQLVPRLERLRAGSHVANGELALGVAALPVRIPACVDRGRLVADVAVIIAISLLRGPGSRNKLRAKLVQQLRVKLLSAGVQTSSGGSGWRLLLLARDGDCNVSRRRRRAHASRPAVRRRTWPSGRQRHRGLRSMASPHKNWRTRGEERRVPRDCVKDTQPTRKHVPLTSQCGKHLLHGHRGRWRRRCLLLVIVGLLSLTGRKAPQLLTAARLGSFPLS